MKCNMNMLFDYIDGNLADENTEKFETHLESCEVCRETIRTFKLMETVGEQEYDVTVDVVQSVKNYTDKNMYDRKKYVFINKYMSNRKSFIKYASLTVIALTIVGGIIINNSHGFKDSVKDDVIIDAFKNKDFDKELADNAKSIVNTSYYNDFIKVLQEKGYQIVEGSFAGGPIQLPQNLDREGKNIDVVNILNNGNKSSISSGLDFSGYLGKRVMLLTCIKEEPNNKRKEIICILTKDRVIGFWEEQILNDNKKELYSYKLLRDLKVDDFKSGLENVSSQDTDFIKIDNLPQFYTVEMARSNGDVLLGVSDNNNDRFHKFLNDYENKVNSRVRIAIYHIKNDATIVDLIYDGDSIKAIINETRDPSISKEIYGTKEYKVLNINKKTKNNTVFYTATLENNTELILEYENEK